MTITDIKDRSPNQHTITHLEGLLEKAKAGELRTIITVCAWDDDAVTHGWSLDARNSRRRMLAEIVMLQHDYTVNLGLEEGDSILSKAFER